MGPKEMACELGNVADVTEGSGQRAQHRAPRAGSTLQGGGGGSPGGGPHVHQQRGRRILGTRLPSAHPEPVGRQPLSWEQHLTATFTPKPPGTGQLGGARGPPPAAAASPDVQEETPPVTHR